MRWRICNFELHDKLESSIFHKNIEKSWELLSELPGNNKLEEQYAKMIEGILLFYVGKKKEAVNRWNDAMSFLLLLKRKRRVY